jgi:hypothetical protein
MSYADRREDNKRPLVECPYDGTPLEFRNGVANCPMGNFRSRVKTQEAANRGVV